MADEVTYGTARATETGETEDLSKAELQRRMEVARESISQTVAEIKDTVVNQYQSVRDTVTETLDWREQYRKRPVAWSLGAMGAGFIVGYSVAGVFTGGDYEDEEDTLSPEDSRVFQLPPSSLESGASHAAPRAYASQAITGGSYGSSAYGGGGEADSEAGQRLASRSADYSYSGGSAATQEADEEPQGPGLIERFKETKAYDRLQEEVSTLGDRFIEELSKTAQAVVLPALFGKLKDLFGVDLSGKSSQSGGGRTASNTASAGGGAANTASAGSGAASGGAGTTGGSPSSYATSENRPYGGGGQGGQS